LFVKSEYGQFCKLLLISVYKVTKSKSFILEDIAMFLKNRTGSLNTTEIIMIILVSLIAVVVPLWRLMSSFGNRMDSVRERLGD